MNNEELEEAMNLLFVDQSEATTRLEIQHDLLLALVAEYRRLKDHILIVDETLARIQDRLPRVLIGGLLPPKDELTRLECQIFQTPNLTPAQRKANKTVSVTGTTRPISLDGVAPTRAGIFGYAGCRRKCLTRCFW